MSLSQPGTISRIAYKFVFVLSPPQWSLLADALWGPDTIRLGHVLCGSTVYFQQLSSTGGPAIDTKAPMTSATVPAWLGPDGANTTCSYDVYAPTHL